MFVKHKPRLYLMKTFPPRRLSIFDRRIGRDDSGLPVLMSKVTAGSLIGFTTHIVSGMVTHWSPSTTILTTTGYILLPTVTCPA
jgi:hypothetical protein